MYDKVTNDTRVYSDIQGLEQLHLQNKVDHKAAKKEVSQQFEAILMQMVLRSMRDANKTFASDVVGSDQMDFYQDFFDKQLSLIMSNNNNSVAKMIEKNIDDNERRNETIDEPSHFNPEPVAASKPQLAPEPRFQPEIVDTPVVVTADKEKTHFETEESFVKHLWPAAKAAAGLLGLTPGILVAQAALETNWGKKILPAGEDSSSHNLFNIKSGADWAKKSTTVESLEQKDGILVKEKSSFRTYGSFKESFMDYVQFLKGNRRYNEALTQTAHPEKFVKALQNAGFATDSHYSDKILKIFSSSTFKKMVSKME